MSKIKFGIVTGAAGLLGFEHCKTLLNSGYGVVMIDINKSLLDQKFMLSRPLHQGRHYLKVVLGNPHTKLSHLDQLAKLLNESLKEKI